MSEFYGLTYLIFKHGTILHRRKIFLQENYLYRVILIQVLLVFNFINCGFSSSNPFYDVFFAVVIGIVTPFGCLTNSLFHKNDGYDVLHRVFGDYRIN